MFVMAILALAICPSICHSAGKTLAELEELLKQVKPDVTTEAQVRALMGEPSDVKDYTQDYCRPGGMLTVEWRSMSYGPGISVKIYKRTGVVREKSIN